MSSTKQRILDAALDLFSANGFEATGMGQIADAVGIRKSSLYSHFASKQEILDNLIAALTEEFEKRSVLSRERETPAGGISVDGLAESIKNQICYVLHDEHIVKVRKLMTIEQYRNSQIAALQTKHAYTDVLNYNRSLINDLIESSVLMDGDREMMAAQLAFPVSAWLYLCDREPEREREVMLLIERHVAQFFRAYKK